MVGRKTILIILAFWGRGFNEGEPINFQKEIRSERERMQGQNESVLEINPVAISGEQSSGKLLQTTQNLKGGVGGKNAAGAGWRTCAR